MKVEKIHHVGYRCRDAVETVNFYRDILGMELIGAVSEDKVPSTKDPDPYMHVFLDAGNGNILAFFELPNSPPMGWDPNTPSWTQHIAFQLSDVDALMKAKEKIVAAGLDVLGPTDHGIFKSLYFHDPSGHRLELAAWTTSDAEMKKLKDVGPAMLAEWAKTKKPPRMASWIHEKEFAANP